MITVKSIYKNFHDLFDRELELNGWIRTQRNSKNFGFIELNDGSYFKNIQIVFNDELKNFDEIIKFTIGSSIKIRGKLVESKGAKQAFEIHAAEIIPVQIAEPDFPLQKKRHSFEYLRTIAHLRPRTNTFRAVFKIRNLLYMAIHNFFQERDFIYVHTPIITASDCEGAGELFQITTMDMENLPKKENGKIDYSKDFFGKKSYLTVSGQIELETLCMTYNKVYDFGPVFRAENSNTTRHVSEFWMMDAEIAFADINDNMDLAEDMMKYIINDVLEKAPEEMEFFDKFIEKGLLKKLDLIVNSDFERITYTEAIDILLKKKKQNWQYPVEWGKELQTEHERYLCEKVFKKPVFVIDYPKDVKAFYMKLNDDGKTVAGMDLLVPGVGEIIGGSQREDDYDVLVRRIKEMGLDEKEYWWYLDLRKYGGTPHAGFGLGFERAIMYITGMENIRDVIPFPRTPKNCEF